MATVRFPFAHQAISSFRKEAEGRKKISSNNKKFVLHTTKKVYVQASKENKCKNSFLQEITNGFHVNSTFLALSRYTKALYNLIHPLKHAHTFTFISRKLSSDCPISLFFTF